MRALIVGDTHGNWKKLNPLLKFLKDDYDIILQLGDFGFWPTIKNIKKGTYGLGSLDTQGKKLYWIPGNHEHWDHLDDLIDGRYNELVHVYGNIYHIPLGCVFELNGKKIMGIGGALSIDKEMRTIGRDYFFQEQANYAQCSRVLSYEGDVDILLVHTIPRSALSYVIDTYKIAAYDSTNNLLEEVIEKYRPKNMYCGHWHQYSSFYLEHTDTHGEVLQNIDDINVNKLKDDKYKNQVYKIVEI